MFTFYCDDSGTHSESPFAVAACFIAPILQWEHFERDWKTANDSEGFGVFHMADFVAKQAQFAAPEWLDETKRDRTLKRLINIINTRRQVGFYAVVEKAGYDAEVPQPMRGAHDLGNNHYSFAVRMCMAKVLKWRMRYGYKDPVKFVFDRMSKGAGEINAIFEQALKEGDEKALAHGISREVGWSFENKSKFIPLQAADILAWEALYHMRRVFLAHSQTARRKSFQALSERLTEGGYHDSDSMRKWVAHVRARTNATW
jgi:hypothetical protein